MGVIGHGDIAVALPDRTDLLFFASGVSNSQETRESEYQREVNLILRQPQHAHIVYFSSLGVLDGTSRYYQHKQYMEALVKTWEYHTIVRIGNITWGENSHTLINYLKTHPEAEIRDEYRYIVDKDEFLYWVNLIPPWSCELSIPGRRMKVQQIVNEIKEGKL